MLKFHNHWDKTAIAITAIESVFIVGFLLPMFLDHAPYRWVMWAVIAFGAIIIFSFTIQTPRYLTLRENKLIVRQLVGRIIIPVEKISSVEPIDNFEWCRTFRTFGGGGFCGWLGIFWNNQLGRFRMYITERRNLIVVRTEHRTYVFNCAEPQKLINYLSLTTNL